MLLDVRTMAFLLAVTPFMLGLVMAYYWKRRKVYGGFGRWVLATFGFSVGFILISLRDGVPDFFSIIVGNVFLIYSEILIFEGTQIFFDRPAFSSLNYLVLTIYALLQLFFTYHSPDVNARVVLVSAAFMILGTRSGLSLSQSTIPELKRIAKSSAFIFFIMAFIALSRGIYAFHYVGQITLFSDIMNSWYSLIVIAAIMLWTFYFFILNSARLELDLETAHHTLALIANTDSLTGLYNRRYLLERAETEMELARNDGNELSLLLVDVDDFKLINDRFGHAAGDRVLVQLAQSLQASVRYFDIVSRYGGDEFCILLRRTDRQEALTIAERIRATVENAPMRVDSQVLYINISIGLSSFDPNDKGLELFLTRTDKALYQAKRQGRNLVRAI